MERENKIRTPYLPAKYMAGSRVDQARQDLAMKFAPNQKEELVIKIDAIQERERRRRAMGGDEVTEQEAETDEGGRVA